MLLTRCCEAITARAPRELLLARLRWGTSRVAFGQHHLTAVSPPWKEVGPERGADVTRQRPGVGEISHSPLVGGGQQFPLAPDHVRKPGRARIRDGGDRAPLAAHCFEIPQGRSSRT